MSIVFRSSRKHRRHPALEGAFGEQRVALQADPSMVITAETPLTDQFLATACPDQGWIVGQDVGDDGA